MNSKKTGTQGRITSHTKDGMQLVSHNFYNHKYVTGSDSDDLRTKGRKHGEKNPSFPLKFTNRIKCNFRKRYTELIVRYTVIKSFHFTR